jgi:hypothetical protein
MLIYLDAMIAQYIADNLDYIMTLGGYLPQDAVNPASLPKGDPKLLVELQALGQMAFLDQLGSDWCYAATPHFLKELRKGRPKPQQTELYDLLETSWHESEWLDAFPLDSEAVGVVENGLLFLCLKEADRLHLAQAIILGASWFLTNDYEILGKCRLAQKVLCKYQRPCFDPPLDPLPGRKGEIVDILGSPRCLHQSRFIGTELPRWEFLCKVEKCGKVDLPLRVCRPSEFLEGVSVGLFLRTEGQ